MGLFTSKYKKKYKKEKRKAHKYEREAKDYKREIKDMKKEEERRNNPQAYQPIQEEALNQAVALSQKERDEARAKGKLYADEVLGRQYQGLTPQQRQIMEERGNQAINREMQGYQRQLLAQQGRNNLKGGAAYAQQADLARIGTESQQELQRDISNLDSDLALKKLAAAFNIEQGEAGQRQLDRQLALDEAKLEHERRRQRKLEEQYNRLFSRV